MLLIALLNLPIGYFTFLRILIFAGAIWVAIDNLKIIHWLLIFILIAILFNPIIPIYLYQKYIWIPIDISCAILFLIEAFVFKKPKDENNQNPNKLTKVYTRDKIH